MTKTRYVNSYRDLIVYMRSRQLSQKVFLITQSFPREETYSLIDQVRRSSRSIGAQIAESWAKRNYEKHFTSKLSDADSEVQETRPWGEISLDCGYITTETAEELLQTCDEIGRMLGGMIQKAHLFCVKDAHLRESTAVYWADSSHDPASDH